MRGINDDASTTEDDTVSKVIEMITLEGARQGRAFAVAVGADIREEHAMDDFQDASIEACCEFGLMLNDGNEDLCSAFTSAFAKAAIAYTDSAREG
jgi:hypothetical protein